MKKSAHQNYPYVVIGNLLEVFLAEQKGVLNNKSIEPLHRMRVASRRLRTALWAFKSFFPKEELKRTKKMIRNFSRSTGQARDFDTLLVFAGRKREGLKKSSAYREGLAAFALFLQKERARVQVRVAQAVRQIEEKKFRKQATKLLERYCQHLPSHNKELRALARKRISRRLDELLACERYAYQPHSINKLHQLRIAAKHLRYSLEVFEKVLGKRTRQFIQDAWSIQRSLGALHDYDVWIVSLPSMARKKKDKSIARAADYLARECTISRRKMYCEFLSTWKALKKRRTWEQLRTLVSHH